MSKIHSTAIIEEGAQIGDNVIIEPYAIIKSAVKIKDNVTVKAHAYIEGYTTIGKGCVIWPYASIGAKPQDLKYRGEKTFVEIGENTEIREFVTINSSCSEGSVVKIGDKCLIMAYCHVAHNCSIGNGVIMANNSMLAGHVTVEDYAIIGGFTPVHQFCRIGRYSMVGGFSRVSHDVPPYTIGGGYPYRFGGLNLVGLKRHKFSLEVRKKLSQAFKITFRMNLRLKEAIAKIEKEIELIPEVSNWLSFCKSTKRGLLCLQGISQNEPEEKKEEKELIKDLKQMSSLKAQ